MVANAKSKIKIYFVVKSFAGLMLTGFTGIRALKSGLGC
jgi:hypothetical protein